MDVLAVREATRFAIDYCSVQAKVRFTHLSIDRLKKMCLSLDSPAVSILVVVIVELTIQPI